jgi:hypothetical protein
VSSPEVPSLRVTQHEIPIIDSDLGPETQERSKPSIPHRRRQRGKL